MKIKLLVSTLPAMIVLAAFAFAQKPDARGHWSGAIDVPGSPIEIIVDLDQDKDGKWKGAIAVPPQGLKDFVLSGISVQGADVAFEMAGIPGDPAFKGKLSDDGSKIIGEISQGGVNVPFTLERKGAAQIVSAAPKPTDASSAPAGGSIEGNWEGTLDVNGVKLRLVLKVSRGSDGALTAKMDSPDQGASDIPVSSVVQKGDAINFELSKIQGAYEGRLNKDASEISGEWKQGGGSLPLTLKRTTKPIGKVLRPQEPTKPYPYDEQEVAYDNKAGGVHLAGTLTLPKEKGPFPAVLLITGSGPQDRNEALMGHKPFLVLSDYLTRRGIAVLRVDDRGVGGSTGSVSTSTAEDFAADVLAGVEFLKSRKEINPSQIGLIGHSEGGIVAPLAASKSKDIAFIVLMAGTGLTGEEILYLQAALIEKAGGASDEAIATNNKVQRAMFTIVKEEKDNAAAEKRMKENLTNMMAGFTEEQRKALGTSSALDAQVKSVLSPWFRYFLVYDPRPALKKVNCPVLALNGERDLQVPPKEDLSEIAKALAEGGNKDYKTVLLPGLNHLFQTSTTGSPLEYGKIDETMAPIALQTMGDWIVAQTKKVTPDFSGRANVSGSRGQKPSESTSTNLCVLRGDHSPAKPTAMDTARRSCGRISGRRFLAKPRRPRRRTCRAEKTLEVASPRFAESGPSGGGR